jgi:branched-chain amino acid transport system permease protein
MSAVAASLVVVLGLMIVLSLSLNLAVGHAGLFNLGHAAFYAIGAFTGTLLLLDMHWPWPAAFLAGGLFAAAFGYLIGLLTLRLSGDYFAIATLGFAVVTSTVLLNWQSLTRGPMGIPGIPRPSLFDVNFTSDWQLAALVAAFAGLVWFTVGRLTRSPWGRLLHAVRDDEIAAQALGKRTLAVKTQAVALSAFIAGCAGVLYAAFLQYIDPTIFNVNLTIAILVAVIFGGLGNNAGAIAGATLLTLAQQALIWLNVPTDLAGTLQQIFYSLLLIGMMILRPKGLLPERVRIHLAGAGDA